jgi:hypothetical protein
MFSILIIIFSFKFINYFINNINYIKNIFLKQIIIFRILELRNLGPWWTIQYNWIFTQDSLIVGPDAGPILLGSSTMTQASSVPKWGAGMAPSQRRPSATCAQGCAQHRGRSLSATCALRLPAHSQAAQAPRVHWGMPNTQATTQAPCMRWGLPSTQQQPKCQQLLLA